MGVRFYLIVILISISLIINPMYLFSNNLSNIIIYIYIYVYVSSNNFFILKVDFYSLATV